MILGIKGMEHRISLFSTAMEMEHETEYLHQNEYLP
jgi:hypothetical protein